MIFFFFDNLLSLLVNFTTSPKGEYLREGKKGVLGKGKVLFMGRGLKEVNCLREEYRF